MCLTPSRLKDGTLVACRGCRVCLDNRLNDLVGRCVAEQHTSTETFAVTLTYAGDTPKAVFLAYADVQNMLKRLRRDGFKVRYICAGEYGTKKGRAHWHIVLFFQGRAPDVEKDLRVNWEYWPHGFSYFQSPDYGGFRYVMKYALKDQDSRGHTKALSMSKKPPLGYDFFMEMVADLVDRQLPVHAPEYAFAHIKTKTGKARRYWLQGRMREMFLQRYCDLWQEKWGCEPPQSDWLVEQYLDRIARKEMEADGEGWGKRLDARRPKRVYLEPLPEGFGDDEPRISESVGYLALSDRQKGAMIVIAYSDGSWTLTESDGTEWTGENGTKENVALQLRASGLTQSLRMQVCEWLASKSGSGMMQPQLAAE